MGVSNGQQNSGGKGVPRELGRGQNMETPQAKLRRVALVL